MVALISRGTKDLATLANLNTLSFPLGLVSSESHITVGAVGETSSVVATVTGGENVELAKSGSYFDDVFASLSRHAPDMSNARSSLSEITSGAWKLAGSAVIALNRQTTAARKVWRRFQRNTGLVAEGDLDGSISSRHELENNELVVEQRKFTNRSLNPFENATPTVTKLEILKILLLFPIVFLRVLLLIFSLLGAYIVCLISTTCCCCFKKSDGLPSCLLFMFRIFVRLFLHGLGYHWIRTRGSPDSVHASIIVANHVGFAENGYLMYCYNGCVVSKSENARIPLIGTILKALRTILVDRQDPNSRHKTMEAIKKHASLPGKHVLIFPEGTDTNGCAVISFKPGAFVPGLPIQSVTFSYPFKNFDASMLNDTFDQSLPFFLLRHTWQVYNVLSVNFLPTYFPSEAEKDNPKLFASNVRTMIAEDLGVPTTEHSYDDLCLYLLARKTQFKDPSQTLVGMAQLNNMTLKEAKQLLLRFEAIDKSGTGVISFDDFILGLEIQPTKRALKSAKHMYSMLDVDGDGMINFRDFIIGMANLSSCRNETDIRKLVFDECFDIQGNGSVTLEAFLLANGVDNKRSALSGLGIVDEDRSKIDSMSGSSTCESRLRAASSSGDLTSRADESNVLRDVFKAIDCDGDGIITYVDFLAYANSKPDAFEWFVARVMAELEESHGRSLYSCTTHSLHNVMQYPEANKPHPPSETSSLSNIVVEDDAHLVKNDYVSRNSPLQFGKVSLSELEVNESHRDIVSAEHIDGASGASDSLYDEDHDVGHGKIVK